MALEAQRSTEQSWAEASQLCNYRITTSNDEEDDNQTRGGGNQTRHTHIIVLIRRENRVSKY